jgi:transposase-like protein
MKNAENHLPKTLQEAIRYFSDNLLCVEFVASLRWPDGIAVCPNCGKNESSFLKTRNIWKCKGCKKQFSVKVGTIFEDSPLGLDKWLTAIWMIANCKNGISSYELHRAVGITQKSAWFVLHRIRTAMQIGSIEKLYGEVEVDEVYLGGDSKNMHASKRARTVHGRGSAHKTAVLGMVERKGRVRAKVVEDVTMRTLHGVLKSTVDYGSILYSDANRAYENLHNTYTREVINHSFEYVRDNCHTNSIENFWSLLKRTIKGTYVSVEPAHLQRYVEEQTFRYNERRGNDQDRFIGVIRAISGKRITYAQLIGSRTMGH